MFAVTLLVAFESRRLEVSILYQKGVKNIHMYPSYLMVSLDHFMYA
jgi:hypothetical protein